MKIALLFAKPDVRRSTLDQQDFILNEVPVLRQCGSRSKRFRSGHKTLRAVILRAHFQHELGGGRRTAVDVNAASPQLPLISFEQERPGGRI